MNIQKEYVLGISSNGSDSSACLFRDGQLLCAVEEERFTRIRHDGRFPENAIQWCMENAGITADKIHHIAVSWDYPRYQNTVPQDEYILEFYKTLQSRFYCIDWKAIQRHIQKFQPAVITTQLKRQFPRLGETHLHFHRHHDCHAASSYCFSGHDKSFVLVMDEKGEDICTSLYIGEGEHLHPVDRLKLPHSLGLFYAAVTQFLRFLPFRDEGTFMALASTGKSNPALKTWLLEKVFCLSNNRIEINPAMVSKDVFAYPRRKGAFFTMQMDAELNKQGLRPPEEPGAFIEEHRDFAFTVQEVLEIVVLDYLNSKTNRSTIKNLCIAGGVGLNCTLNGQVIRGKAEKPLYRHVFVPPWPGDSGGAIGAALLTLAKKEKQEGRYKVPIYETLDRADWGPAFSDVEIKKCLGDKKIPFYRSPNIVKEVTTALANKKIIAWFQGQAEFGPRALGQRSVLCDPRWLENKNRLQLIKQRLPFRPYAPSILEEHADRYFNPQGGNYWFMTTTFQASERAILEIPAALNQANNTLRPQLVSKKKGWLYRELIETFFNLTGIPALLNTSFNIKEPIVLSPADAISTFANSDIDILAIGNYIVKNVRNNRGGC